MPSIGGPDRTNPEILTPLQQLFMRGLFADAWFRQHFYLTGGTAVAAFYLFHRYSEGLDFFSHGVELTPIPALIETVSTQLQVPAESVQSHRTFLRYRIGEDLKIDVVGDVEVRIGAPELRGDFMVDSLKNIAVNKVCTILGRFDAKDYVDLFFILKENPFDIFDLLRLGQQKDGGLEPFIWASLIADVTKLKVFPKMIRQVTPEELHAFFLTLRDTILERLNPQAP
ncbi:MAG: nucleotidyl transferase AbiEii/AbiGii toxin family protein [Deltaproteobacteria bacterium]|nr:nucleotidyl transferase AbiEii/AbiGii toxin family protein [Deltaproteobacteria bacterium]